MSARPTVRAEASSRLVPRLSRRKARSIWATDRDDRRVRSRGRPRRGRRFDRKRIMFREPRYQIPWDSTAPDRSPVNPRRELIFLRLSRALFPNSHGGPGGGEHREDLARPRGPRQDARGRHRRRDDHQRRRHDSQAPGGGAPRGEGARSRSEKRPSVRRTSARLFLFSSFPDFLANRPNARAVADSASRSVRKRATCVSRLRGVASVTRDP
jgi:hypothetical protein